MGDGAGWVHTSGGDNTFVGSQAGFEDTSGSYNTFIGGAAGRSNIFGAYNTFLGYCSGRDNTTGDDNTFIGSAAGYYSTSGVRNTCVGASAGMDNTAGHENTYLGTYAGLHALGSENVFIGTGAGLSAAGSSNVFIGYYAGTSETGSNKLYIANDADTGSVLIYGDFSSGRVGIGTTSPGYKLDVDGDINTTGEIRQGGFSYNFPDYVFEPDYELMPLTKLEDFVAEKKHLPGMPSAEEVKKEGVKLFEQNRLLVEKLEEAYLYILELQERVSRLENGTKAKLSTVR